MKPVQRIILISALLLFLLSVLFVPYADRSAYGESGYQWLFESRFYKLDVPRLLLEWLGLGCSVAALWLFTALRLPTIKWNSQLGTWVKRIALVLLVIGLGCMFAFCKRSPTFNAKANGFEPDAKQPWKDFQRQAKKETIDSLLGPDPEKRTNVN